MLCSILSPSGHCTVSLHGHHRVLRSVRPGHGLSLPGLYQSCQASASLEDALTRAQVDPTTSRQANILHQRQQLLGQNTSTNQGTGTVMKTALDALDAESEVSSRFFFPPFFPRSISVMLLNSGLKSVCTSLRRRD